MVKGPSLRLVLKKRKRFVRTNKDYTHTYIFREISFINIIQQGIFSSVLKDNKATKSLEVETEDSRLSIEGLSTIFSIVNFPTDHNEIEEKNVTNSNNEDVELDIGISFLQCFCLISSS